MQLVDNIKFLCTENNLSIPKLEKLLGLSNGSIYNWNKSFPAIDKVIKIADYFEVSLDEITGRVPFGESYNDKNTISLAARNTSENNEDKKDIDTIFEDLEVIQRLGQYLSAMGRAELEKHNR
ncbi:MAG: helix-turn-helix domain-containing protein [Cellulosilyticaceae bacterium]